MIQNFEEITEPLTDKELTLVAYVYAVLSNRVNGKTQAIKSSKLCDLINDLVTTKVVFFTTLPVMDGVRLRKIVNYMRKNAMAPIIATSNGYYVSNDVEEIEKQITSMKERANGILDAAKGLEKYCETLKQKQGDNI